MSSFALRKYVKKLLALSDWDVTSFNLRREITCKYAADYLKSLNMLDRRILVCAFGNWLCICVALWYFANDHFDLAG